MLWCFVILSNVYAATLAVFARGRRKAAAIAFVLASAGFAGCRFVSGYFNIGGFFPVDNFFLVLGINATFPDPDTVLRLRAGNAVATMLFGLIGSLVGLFAFRAAGHNEASRMG